jgi:hypothetical protein
MAQTAGLRQVAFIGTGLAIADANNVNSQATITCTPH